MTIRECLKGAEQTLQNASVPDPKTDAAYLLAHVCGLNRMELLLNASREINPEQERLFQSLLLSRVERKPLQYLLGHESFYGLELNVDERVLIPRPETELLVEEALRQLRSKRSPRLLDLCCGSGAIALALAHERQDAVVYGSDISADALCVAKANGEKLGLAVQWVESDLLDAFGELRFDAIITNPPYIPTEDCRQLQAEVLQEPLSALDGGADGLELYRRILRAAPKHLSDGGLLLMECGNDETEILRQMMEAQGFTDTGIKQDLEHQPRMVWGHWMEVPKDAAI